MKQKKLDLSLSSPKEEKYFKEFVKILFTSFIRIKKYGKYYIKISFFNQKRECIKTIRYIEINSFSLNFKLLQKNILLCIYLGKKHSYKTVRKVLD